MAFVCIVRRFYLFYFLQPDRYTNVGIILCGWVVPSYNDDDGEGAIMGFYNNIIHIGHNNASDKILEN